MCAIPFPSVNPCLVLVNGGEKKFTLAPIKRVLSKSHSYSALEVGLGDRLGRDQNEMAKNVFVALLDTRLLLKG